MKKFRHQLWGYQLSLPENWHHQSFDHKDGFSEDPDAFLPDYKGPKLAQLLINGEWNSLQQPVFDLWQKHLVKVSLMLGAKNLASAQWTMAGASGYELEIILPKKNPRRLWTGILENGMLVLSFLVLHWKENREEVEPLISRIISSLAYLRGIDSVTVDEQGLPLPEPVQATDPQGIVSDITDPENWHAYRTDFTTGELQAFYLRELPQFGWEVTRYVPYPNPGEYPFARIIMEKAGQFYSLGLLPDQEKFPVGNIVLKSEPDKQLSDGKVQT